MPTLFAEPKPGVLYHHAVLYHQVTKSFIFLVSSCPCPRRAAAGVGGEILTCMAGRKGSTREALWDLVSVRQSRLDVLEPGFARFGDDEDRTGNDERIACVARAPDGVRHA